jgi:serine/threonine-protein kinase
VVALTLLRPEFASDEGLIRRLLRAARTVEHRHLVGLLDAGAAEGEHYLAPELLRGDEPNAASDIYAFGCLVYACVAGRPPFGDRGLFAIGAGHLDEEPPDPCAARSDAPQGFAEAVGFALRKAPADRPSTATARARLIAVGARGGSG